MSTSPHNTRLIVWILGALATVTPFAIDLYLPSFAQIAEEFGTTAAKISLSVSSYFIGMAVGQMLYGPLLDRFGRKNPLYAGLVVFIMASGGCSMASDTEALIALRFIQALGGSVAWVAALAMVRDFFPVHESAKIFSLLFLVIGVSPLLAPTVGGFITTALGWRFIFITLALIAVFVIGIVRFYLPDGQAPDTTVSLRAKPMANTFFTILTQPQFATFVFAGAFSFSTLFIYVAGSPVIFMEIFNVGPQVYGGIFAFLSVGFIGGSQVNIFLSKRFGSDKIFRIALFCQLISTVLFLLLALNNWVDLYVCVAMFFACLTCIGLTNPNASALALAPFTRNIGSASALMAFTQIGISALASAGIAAFDSLSVVPVVSLMTVTCAISVFIYWIGQRRLGTNIVMGAVSPENVGH